jgi:hypothetical protein
MASSIAMGTGPAQPAAGANSATYLIYKQSTHLVIKRTTFNPPN